MAGTPPAPPSLLQASTRRGPVTPRSVILGLGCVVFIAAFAPYNDFALNNTFFIGNHFPVGVTVLMCVLVLAVNPLLKCIHTHAPLRCGELITVWAMCLVGSAFPTSGLLRPLIPLLASPIYMLPQHPHWEQVLDFLPQWLFPTTNPDNDAIVTQFFLGAEPDQPARVPWGPWVQTLSLWALYLAPFYAGVLLLSILFSKQWIENEKLQYPIATVMLEMVRDAPPGRALNALFSNRHMWTSAVVVMVIHLINGLHTYYPKFPPIPLHFNLSTFTTEGVWDHLMTDLKINGVYFSMVGIAFLMAAEVSLSLWLMVVIYGIAMGISYYHGINPWEAMRSQSYGAMLAMGAFLLFLARTHLWRTFRIAFRPPRNEEERHLLPYRWVVRSLIGCIVCCVAWLWATGMPLPVAVAQIILVYLMYLVMSRLVAETGLFFVQPRMWTEHLFPLIAPRVLSPKSYALAVKTIYPTFYPRETLMPFAFNALRMGYETQREEAGSTPVITPVRRSFLGAMAAAMVVAVIVGAAVSISLYYNRGAVRTNTKVTLNWVTTPYQAMSHYLQEVPTPPGQGPFQVAVGAALLLTLGICRLRFSRWPLVPITLCFASSDALGLMWFSILIGWLCKVSVMRLGGVALFNRLRPVFLGMLIGEVLIAGAWMIVGAIVRFNGYELTSVTILPGYPAGGN